MVLRLPSVDLEMVSEVGVHSVVGVLLLLLLNGVLECNERYFSLWVLFSHKNSLVVDLFDVYGHGKVISCSFSNGVK